MSAAAAAPGAHLLNRSSSTVDLSRAAQRLLLQVCTPASYLYSLPIIS